MDLQEIDAIVFAETVKGPIKNQTKKDKTDKEKSGRKAAPTDSSNQYHHKREQPEKQQNQSLQSVNQSKSSINNPYEEEESYENPVNISKAPGC